jgi:hypothetical protein
MGMGEKVDSASRILDKRVMTIARISVLAQMEEQVVLD